MLRMGYLKVKSSLMIYDRNQELQNKRIKVFWTREYYIEIIGNINDEAVQKSIKEHKENSKIFFYIL